jgi:hypothetical protein
MTLCPQILSEDCLRSWCFIDTPREGEINEPVTRTVQGEEV